MAISHKFDVYNVNINDDYIRRCARKYLGLLTATKLDNNQIDEDPRFSDLGFTADKLKELIKKYSVPSRIITDKKRDIYRSDLGELVMISFFEQNLDSKYPGEGNFVIPIKNISDRENIDMPARGLDVFGYRLDDKITILLGEAKVSDEKKSPPQVVDSTSDSLYKTHTQHRVSKDYLLKKLTNIARKLSAEHAAYLLQVIVYIEENFSDRFRIVYGCCLVRDSQCHNSDDFGKMKLNSKEFDPNTVHFIIINFSQPIADTVEKFYKKVIELSN